MLLGISNTERNSMLINITWANANPNTIWGRLASKLGRAPTHAEATNEVKRILRETTAELAAQGRLPHQRRRAA